MSVDPYDKISVNIPRGLLEKIDAAAAKDHRTRSSWLIHNLEALMNESRLEDAPAGKTSSPFTPVASAAVTYPAARTRKKSG